MATVTFAAGLAVPGGFNGSGAGQDHGIATALKKTMFHVFSACNTLTVFNSMVVVLMLLHAQINDPQAALFAYGTAVLPLLVALKCPRIHGRLVRVHQQTQLARKCYFGYGGHLLEHHLHSSCYVQCAAQIGSDLLFAISPTI
ncbi:hypothetical protein NL676_000865 [Syzygium grande]|nr:hypothetical protein NL676_000865 [Syzygium grande]